ncbi:MAG: hypothetical protein OXG88_05045 [Gammaproteobacteria bacterium]|nr:hypothetical protein [Gammaproteobacteria bacterium]
MESQQYTKPVLKQYGKIEALTFGASGTPRDGDGSNGTKRDRRSSSFF